MAQLAGNNLGINYNFDLGSGGWKAAMDNNLFLSDAFLQPFIKGVVNDPLGSPARGDMVIVDDSPTGVFIGHIGEIAIYNEITPGWDFLVPREGWKVYDQITNLTFLYDGTNWILDRNPVTVTTDTSTSGRTIALTDAGTYIRMTGNGNDPLTVTVPQNLLVPLPIGTKVFVTQTTNSTVTLAEDAGVTLNTANYKMAVNHSVLLIKVGTDEWDVQYISDSGWVTGTTPTFDNVAAPTTENNEFKYKLDGRVLHWKIKMDYTGLDTADVDTLSITPAFPFPMVDRYGIAQLQILGSTGITLLATDTFHASYNQSADAINIVDNAGAAMTYDSGKVNAAGVIFLSGTFEI